MLQVLFRLPIKVNWAPEGIPIYGFGMMLFLAFLICTWLAGRRAEGEGIPRQYIQDLAIWLFIGGLLGARVTYILQDNTMPQFGARWLGELVSRLPRIWDGGII